ncbi:hypothetical protein [Luteimonas sp. R10]|uniref:hypothetical protein n=1 Tax=Luteimonas sp. R10 TaxID=3108176 RepID=UPI003092A4A0|nr:hypothetical protein U3649_00025 [Luteimonas sp. R10]
MLLALACSPALAQSGDFSIDLQVRNLADHGSEYVWYDAFFWGGDDQPMFSAAPGRSAYVSFDMKL